jgi:murein DD-endopeptidase MepM/ murein hydrolase activator NlpD
MRGIGRSAWSRLGILFGLAGALACAPGAGGADAAPGAAGSGGGAATDAAATDATAGNDAAGGRGGGSGDASAGGDAAGSDAAPGDGGGEPDGAPSDGGAPAVCGSTPAANNVVIPVFDRIFTGTFSLVNHFDHDVPQEFSDANGYQIDWCGRRRTTEIDGHSGYDFVMPEGTPILAAADGTVNWAGDDISFYCPLKGQQITDQQRVEITHRLPDGRRVTANYKHFSRVDVSVGQQVHAGDVIGLSGNTGCSTGPHLHFETWLMDGTRTGTSELIDSFGWEGAGADPWAATAAASIWLWKPGTAPDIF